LFCFTCRLRRGQRRSNVPGWCIRTPEDRSDDLEFRKFKLSEKVGNGTTRKTETDNRKPITGNRKPGIQKIKIIRKKLEMETENRKPETKNGLEKGRINNKKIMLISSREK
jgi:hypothetical protein